MPGKSRVTKKQIRTPIYAWGRTHGHDTERKILGGCGSDVLFSLPARDWDWRNHTAGVARSQNRRLELTPVLILQARNNRKASPFSWLQAVEAEDMVIYGTLAMGPSNATDGSSTLLQVLSRCSKSYR